MNCLNNILKISLLITTLLFSGCGFSSGEKHNIATKKDFKGFEAKEKGIVIFMITERTNIGSVFSNNFDVSLGYKIIKKCDENEIILNSENQKKYVTFEAVKFLGDKVANYNDSVLFLTPGTYIVTDIHLLDKGGYRRWYKHSQYNELDSQYNELGRISYGAFKVKGGEITSLGRLDVSDGKFVFNREDNLIKENFMRTRFRDLIPRMIPGDFYQSNSLFYRHKDKQGNILGKIIPREEVLKASTALLDSAKIDL